MLSLEVAAPPPPLDPWRPGAPAASGKQRAQRLVCMLQELYSSEQRKRAYSGSEKRA